MKKIALFFAFAVVAACTQKPVKENNVSENQDSLFDKYKAAFVEELWKLNPEWASTQGFHKYDHVLTVTDKVQKEKELAFAKANLDSLHQFDPSLISDNNKTDYYILENYFHGVEFGVNSMKSYEWDPSQYNVSSVFAEMINNNYDSLDIRLHNLGERIKNVPAYYAAAKTMISNPTIEHTQLAIEQNTGGKSVFEKDLKEALVKSTIPQTEKDIIAERAVAALKAIDDYTGWLKSLKNDHPRSFRLGKDLYAKKFVTDLQSGYSADEIFNKAIAHKQELHLEMYKLADQLWPKYMKSAAKPADSLELIRDVIDVLSLKHVKPDEFQAAIEKQIPVLTAFVQEKNLLTMDPTKPLVVRREPDYMAGVAGASITAPGPYDKNGNTYYNVGSLSGWSKEEAESYLREYNFYILQILNIHEAIPGHYTQLIYSNQSPSLIKSIFGNNAMIEGWVVYAERMMLENGYGNNEPEMWLMYYKWNLRSTCNTILDYSVHTLNMSKEEAMDLLIRQAFQQKAEAEGKWRRVSLTQVQLCCYFTGYTEIYEFREAEKKRLGDKFDLKAFHEKFLSYGSAPVKDIKVLMGL